MRQVRHLPVAPRLAPPLPELMLAARVEPMQVAMGGTPKPPAQPVAMGGTPKPPEADEIPSGDDGERLLQVGDIAKATGKTVRAIHHYEDVGLLRPHARSKGRYRLYDQAALARVRWIGKLHDLGLSLGQIQELVQLFETSSSAPGAMGRIRAIYAQKLDETRAQVQHLATLERELVASLDYLDTCDTCDPAELVRACSCCNHHDKTQPEPHLVAGIHAGQPPGQLPAQQRGQGATSDG